MNFVEQLNESQRSAVVYNDGPLLVIAGAGSGKTRVLTYKIAYLIQQGVRASNILALTFTNKAAREMKSRITQLVPPESARYLWMGTFHSICSRLLRNKADRIGYTKDFTIYDTTDSHSLLKHIVKDMCLDEKVYKPNTVAEKISAAKQVLMTAQSYAMNANIQKQNRYNQMEALPLIYSTYQQRLRQANAMDFDDLLVNTCLLLQNDAEVLREYQEIFQYVLVDEYQDTNYAQYLIVKLLGEPQNNVCVVGDDAQSIYSFRGADIRNILSFQQGYPNAKMFKLERNYRSTQTIVKAANSLIHHNEHQVYKEVYSEKEKGDLLRLTECATDLEEAATIVRYIEEEKRLRKVSYDEIAVLYRTNAQSRTIENELRKQGVAYRIYGGTSFYQRKEIKDAVAYFRLLVNPQDGEALLRVINFPARGIGNTTLDKIREAAAVNNVSMMEVVDHPDQYALPVNKGTLSKLQAFSQTMAMLSEQVDSADAYTLADMVLHKTGIMSAAIMDKSQEGVDRKENLDELLSGINEFMVHRQEQGISFTPIQDFLAEVSLLTDQDEHIDDTQPRVTLMTVHAAKGLEFKSVFIAGLEENLFPSQYCQSSREIEEERRLLYVAVTRAMERCYISYAKSRFRNGVTNMSTPSRFLKDIDKQYLQRLLPTSTARPLWGNMSWGAKPQKTSSVQVTSVPASSSRQPVDNNDANLAKGDRVRHKLFGTGVVLAIYRENDMDKIEIQFDKIGKKVLLLLFAKLEKIL